MHATPWKLTTLSPRDLIVLPFSERSSAKNSQPLVSGNFARGCLTITSAGRSCRNVPAGYSLSGTLFLKMRTASLSFSGSAFLMYVFLILVPSLMQEKDFSDTVTSSAYAPQVITNPSPTATMPRVHTKVHMFDK